MTYIQSEKSEQCIFCSACEITDGLDNLIIYRGERAFVILNRYPYTSGHLMIVPFEHSPNLESLERATRAEIMEITCQAITALRGIYNPEGFNIGINIGGVAGAGVEEHVHMHVVPRWSGDTNFMSSLANTRVIPEGLDETYWRVKEAWEECGNTGANPAESPTVRLDK